MFANHVNTEAYTHSHAIPTQYPNPRYIGDHLLAHPIPHLLPCGMWCSASVLTASGPTASVPCLLSPCLLRWPDLAPTRAAQMTSSREKTRHKVTRRPHCGGSVRRQSLFSTDLESWIWNPGPNLTNMSPRPHVPISAL